MLTTLALLTLTLDYRHAAEDLTDRIETTYWVADRKQYAEEISLSGRLSEMPAFTWDKAVYLSAAAAGARLDPQRWQPLFDRIMNSLQSYGCTRNGVFGYSDLPVKGKENDRFYDDNVWIVLAQIEMFEASRARRYLANAEMIFKFVLSGESNELGGGIFWRENERKSKNACSNAPSAFAAAKLYLLTRNHAYLQIAERTYAWLKRLRDSDGLMLDNVDLSGKVDRTKWTYNSALMIEAGVALSKATGLGAYIEDAKQTAASARLHWIDPSTGAIKDEASFAHHLADAYFLLDKADPGKGWNVAGRKAVDYAYAHALANGLYGPRWDAAEPRTTKLNLLCQASMARALFAAAASLR